MLNIRIEYTNHSEYHITTTDKITNIDGLRTNCKDSIFLTITFV